MFLFAFAHPDILQDSIPEDFGTRKNYYGAKT